MDKSLVTKATAPDEVPTPGYMFNEIARITHASSDACHQLEAFLLKRLNKDNVHQKYKVLKVMKHCCTHGHMTFRRDMQRETTAIKACLSYRGTPDPMHGDTLNKAVRDMAQEVMNAVFDTSTASEQLHSAGRMQGFGSEGGQGWLAWANVDEHLRGAGVRSGRRKGDPTTRVGLFGRVVFDPRSLPYLTHVGVAMDAELNHEVVDRSEKRDVTVETRPGQVERPVSTLRCPITVHFDDKGAFRRLNVNAVHGRGRQCGR